MRRTFMDENFDEWEAFVSGGQPGGKDAARVVFVCTSAPKREPRFVRHAANDPADAEHALYHMDDDKLVELFKSSEPLI